MNEARDIKAYGGFRMHSATGYEGGKWFASSYDDAVRWGRDMQRFPRPRPFLVAIVRVLNSQFEEIEFHERWDTIGPAYYVREVQLPAFNLACEITMSKEVFMPGETP